MRKSKKSLKAQIDAERKKFIEVYNKFDRWLLSLKFRPADTRESMNAANYNYWSQEVDGMYSVENFINDTLQYSLHFIRGNNEHVFYVVGDLARISRKIPLEEFKASILEDLRKLKKEKIEELNKIKI